MIRDGADFSVLPIPAFLANVAILHFLVNVAKVGVFLVCEILKGKLRSLSLVLRHGHLLLVFSSEDKVQSGGGKDANDVTVHEMLAKHLSTRS